MPVQGRIRHKRPPAHFVGTLHLFRFWLEEARSALGRLLHFAFDSPTLVPRSGLSTAKAVGTLSGSQTARKDDTGETSVLIKGL